MRGLFTILIAAACLGISGCIFPVPHQRLHVYGVKGKVVDQDNLPLKDAIVFSCADDGVFTKTDESGGFELAPTYGWHGAYFYGPNSLSLWPGFDIAAPEREVMVCAPDCKAVKINVKDYLDPDNKFITIPEPIKIKK
ncbi:MAG: hypothetical protein A2X49_08925 [Lentisphaerae bacterium GWF2_52_8]|nr:MAG: hypothetical protein A2X49_08925 [Lentisphaerae bacterium GWF2_52_8]